MVQVHELGIIVACLTWGVIPTPAFAAVLEVQSTGKAVQATKWLMQHALVSCSSPHPLLLL